MEDLYSKEDGSSSEYSSDADSNSEAISESPDTSDSGFKTKIDLEAEYNYHLSLLNLNDDESPLDDIATTPFFNMPALAGLSDRSQSLPLISQYGLIAGIMENPKNGEDIDMIDDPRLFYNVSSPSSTFICGSQGSGKSHTLSCMLENCLISSRVGNLPAPLTGLLFHYDAFTSDQGGSPCEAAYLASEHHVEVRVLCSPSNFQTMKRIYSSLDVTVEPLRINQKDLNAARMLDLMAVSSGEGPIPLYLQTIRKILRVIRMKQQDTGCSFNYLDFKKRVELEKLTPAQLSPLTLRLDLLESFLPPCQVEGKKPAKRTPIYDLTGNDWTSKPGCLTIVDLSCPFVSAESACALFAICLGIFLEQDVKLGRVIALDEAHKYMSNSTESDVLTNLLLTTIRLQRHIGTRIIISTQEPTVSPKLLDLCSATIVHRFTSPEWFQALRKHLAAATGESEGSKLFALIVDLKVGQALMFSPSTTVGRAKLGNSWLKIRTRARLSKDGGKSIMA